MSQEPVTYPSHTAPRKRNWGRLASIGAILLFVLGKLKILIPAFKFLKFGSLLTMVASVWAYTLFWGLPFAVGFVALIFVHEMGHALVMRRLGLGSGAPVFIPFVGAVIAMKKQPQNAYIESLVGIGGPALGSVGALVCLLIAWATGSPFWYALASTGFLINLFNMIPISPLDGGRIVGVISPWLWIIGYAIGIFVFFKIQSPILALILLLGLFQVRNAFKTRDSAYYQVPRGYREQMGVAYFGLVILLCVGMWAALHPLASTNRTLGLS